MYKEETAGCLAETGQMFLGNKSCWMNVIYLTQNALWHELIVARGVA